MKFHECKVIGVEHYCRTPGQCMYCHHSLLTEDLNNPNNPVGVMMNTDPECEVI